MTRTHSEHVSRRTELLDATTTTTHLEHVRRCFDIFVYLTWSDNKPASQLEQHFIFNIKDTDIETPLEKLVRSYNLDRNTSVSVDEIKRLMLRS